MQLASRYVRITALCLFVFATGLLSAAKPPPAKPKKPEIDRRPMVKVAIKEQKKIRWDLRKNVAIGLSAKPKKSQPGYRVVRAVDVSDFDDADRRNALDSPEDAESPFGLWAKQFDGSELQFTNGYASVVDKTVFTDLRMVRARNADKLNGDGIIVGRVKLKQRNAVSLARSLVGTGIIDANIHVEATITGTYYTSKEGDWFSLHSNDPYWTNRRNTARYNFGIHISTDGAIRVINKRYVGRLLANPKEAQGDSQ